MDTEKIEKFRESFSKQHIDPPSQHLPNFDPRDISLLMENDSFASSFLSWKKGNTENAVKLAVDVLEWRKKNNVTDLSAADIDEDFYKTGACYFRGKDKGGNRILIFKGNLYTKEFEDPARKLFIYLMEQMRKKDPGCRVLFILDAGDCAMSNVDLSLIRLMVDLFMYYFPDMLAKIWVVDMPGLLTVIWNVVKMWFNEDLKSRTGHCSRKDLLKFVMSDQLTTVLGGEDCWTPGAIDEDLAVELQNKEEEETFTDALDNLQLADK